LEGGLTKHEQAKRAIGIALVTLDAVQFHSNPLSPVTHQRSDVRIAGSASRSLSSEDIDIIIVSLASRASQTLTPPLAATQDGSAAQRTPKLVPKNHNAVEKEKPRRPPLSERLFRPLLMSLGFIVETEDREALRLWESCVTGGIDSALVSPLVC
jgi:hypothetical protein